MIPLLILGSYFGIVEMMDLQPRQPVETWKILWINLWQWKGFETGAGRTRLWSTAVWIWTYNLNFQTCSLLSYKIGIIISRSAANWMGPPTRSICGNLIPNVMVFRVWDFERWLGHEGGTLMNGVSALLKQGLREFPHPFCQERTQ